MNRSITFFVTLLFSTHLFSQSLYKSQGFEGSDSWTIVEGSSYISSEKGAFDKPSWARIRTGTGSKSWQVNNTTATLHLQTVDISHKKNVKIIIHFTSTATSFIEGSDVDDYIKVYVSTGNGFPQDPDVTIWGGKNTVWNYYAPKVASATAGTPATFNSPPKFGYLNNTSYSTIKISVPDNATSVELKIVAHNDNEHEFWNVDDIELLATDTTFTTSPPRNFSAHMNDEQSINLSWTSNSKSDSVLIVYNTSRTFGSPIDGNNYNVGDTLDGGGTVIYSDKNLTSMQHSGLTPGTRYYYKAWCVHTNQNVGDYLVYSDGFETDAKTGNDEPSNHVTNFTGNAYSSTSITLSWTNNNGTVAPDGYLIIASTGEVDSPTDGFDPDEDTQLSNGGDATVKVGAASTSYSFNSAEPSKTYNFKIFPFTNAGSSINYKTDGIVPEVQVTTPTNSDEYLIISEIASPQDNQNAKFVEIANLYTHPIYFSQDTWYLSVQTNGGTIYDFKLGGVLSARETMVIALDSNAFKSAYGFSPDTVSSIITGDGNDGYFLYKDGNHLNGTLVDAYGTLNDDGIGKTWEYTGGRAYRKYSVGSANYHWDNTEWNVIKSQNSNLATPGNYPEVDNTQHIGLPQHVYDFDFHNTGIKIETSSVQNPQDISVKFYKGEGPNNVSGISETNVSNYGWYFDLENPPLGGAVNLRFYLYPLPSGIAEGADNIKLYKRETFGTGDFTLVGTLTYHDNGTAGDQSDDWLEYDGISSFSEFVMASNDNALPVELSSFTANVKGNNVILNWQTATEVNNYGFEIQRSTEKTTWSKIGFVEGNGTSNSPKEYSFTDVVSQSGKYSYRLKQIDIDGNYKYSNVVEINIGVPKKFELEQNYPNPFNPTTTIKYSIAKKGFVTLIVYDVLGKQVTTLVNKKLNPGNYSVKFDASNLASGIYFYTLRAGNFVSCKKMLLIK